VIAEFRDFDLRASCISVCPSFKDESATFDYILRFGKFLFEAMLRLRRRRVDRGGLDRCVGLQEAERD
jgi:hypothetical protein